MNIIVNETHYIGKNLIIFKSLTSTNDYAKELISKSTPKNGSVILTEEQTAGRGQAGNEWQTEPNQNITCSIILDTSILEINQQFILNMLVAIAVRQTVYEFITDKNSSVCIKWPNDIMVNNHKIAGILIENSIQGNFLQYSILGIGINVNQQIFSKEIQATSISLENNVPMDKIEIFKKLLLNIENIYANIYNKDYIQQEYLKHLFWKDELKTFSYNNNEISAKIVGVNDFGQLLLEYNNDIIAINNKEIKYII